MYYYTYYSYEEWGRGYIGSRQSKVPPEQDAKYMGSFRDKTFKPTHKIILASHYKTREEALKDEILLQQFFQVVPNSHFANQAYQTSNKFYLSDDMARKIGKQNGKRNKEKKLGICGFSYEQRRKIAFTTYLNKTGLFKLSKEQKSEIGKRNYREGKGIFSWSTEERSEQSKKNYHSGVGIGSYTSEQHSQNGKKAYEMKVGVHALSNEQKSEIAKRNYLNGKCGLHKITPEQRSQNSKNSAKITNSQKWQCLITGYISTAAGVVAYQKKRGIDTSKRIRLS